MNSGGLYDLPQASPCLPSWSAADFNRKTTIGDSYTETQRVRTASGVRNVNQEPTRDSYDVAIVGGGVVGSAIAYFLCAADAFTGRVVVIEKDPSYESSSTTRSVGGVRQQFSTPENIHMSLYSADFIRHVDEHLGVDGEPVSLDFVEAGYLFLATQEGWDVLTANHEVQRRLGADVALLPKPQLAERFPWLNVADLAGGALGLTGEGWIDPHALLAGFRRKALELGAEYVQGEVVALHREGSKIESLELSGGGRIHCGTLVNAAGPRAADVAAMVSVELPVRPRKRQVFVIDPANRLGQCRESQKGCPMVVDPTGLYFRPEGEHFVCGIAPPATDDPDTWDIDVDYDFFEQRVWPLLAHRVEAFESVRCVNAWAGQYAYNTFDQNGIIGRHQEMENLIFANGFSGHGLQQSPAVGRAVSELITHGEFRTLNLSRLGFQRIPAGAPVRERNVV